MKKFNGFMVLALLVSAVSAQAANGFNKGPVFPTPAPTSAPQACWPGENTPKDSIVDGVFGVYVDASSLSGKEVVEIIDAINDAKSELSNGNHFDNTPLSSYGGDHLSAVLTAEKRKGESRDQLISRSDAAIKKLQQLPGVTVDCERRVFPLGAGSGSN